MQCMCYAFQNTANINNEVNEEPCAFNTVQRLSIKLKNCLIYVFINMKEDCVFFKIIRSCMHAWNLTPTGKYLFFKCTDPVEFCFSLHYKNYVAFID